MTTLRTGLTVGDICAGVEDEIKAWHLQRQKILRTALERIVKSSDDKAVEDYMSRHRRDTTADDLEAYFETATAWACALFPVIREEMCGLERVRLYETYHVESYDATEPGEAVEELLNVRLFDKTIKRKVYNRQTHNRAKGNA